MSDRTPPPAEPRVQVIRSGRRRRTAAARLVGDVIEVRIPARMSKEDERRVVERLVGRLARPPRAADLDLTSRAIQLAERYDLPTPVTIRWVTNQTTRWGSCTPATGAIRLSRRLEAFPDWVVDYVIVHELAHLVVPRHGPDFWELVNRYPLTERARGYLIAKSSLPD